jgi:hypothetical protein
MKAFICAGVISCVCTSSTDALLTSFEVDILLQAVKNNTHASSAGESFFIVVALK